jgi:hypothetical protein
MVGVPLLAQPYTNTALPIAQLLPDLLPRMTTFEKDAQLQTTWSLYPRINDARLADSHQVFKRSPIPLHIHIII